MDAQPGDVIWLPVTVVSDEDAKQHGYSYIVSENRDGGTECKWFRAIQAEPEYLHDHPLLPKVAALLVESPAFAVAVEAAMTR